MLRVMSGRSIVALLLGGCLLAACVIGPKPEDPALTGTADTGTGGDADIVGDDGGTFGDTGTASSGPDAAADAPRTPDATDEAPDADARADGDAADRDATDAPKD